MASPKPQVIVRREFELRPDVTAQPLNACIIGPASRVVSFNDLESIFESLNITDATQAPEFTGHIKGANNDKRISGFVVSGGDPEFGLEFPNATNDLAAADASSAPVTVSTGYEIEASTVKVSAKNALIRLMRNRATEDATFISGASAAQSGSAANVIDCKISVVSKPGFPRDAALVDDVKVGDTVYLDYSGAQKMTKVTGFQTETTGQVKKIVLANNVFASGTDTALTGLSIRRRVASVDNIPEIGNIGNVATSAIEPNWKFNKGDGTEDNKVYWGGHNSSNASDAITSGLHVKVPELGTGWFDMPSGEMYVSYTAFRTDLPQEVTTIQNISDIEATFGTDLHPNNLLAWAVYTAKLNAGGQPVYYIPTTGQDLADYVAALSVAETERACYSIVPLTENTAVLSAVEGHVDNMSAPETGKFRIGWFAPEITRGRVIANAAGTIGQALGTITVKDATSGGDPTAATTSYRITSSAVDAFKDARIGALLRFDEGSAPAYNAFVTGDYSGSNLDELLITSVPSNDEVVAKAVKFKDNAAITGATTAADAVIYEEVTGSTLAKEYAAAASGYDNERIFALVPDRGINGMRVNGEPVKNVHLCAAFAGLRSTSAVQQPLSNVTINGFDNLNAGSIIFNETDFSTMRDAGTWVVRQPRTGAQAGKIFAQRQLSTSNLDIFRKEQSVTTNIDNVAFALLDGLHSFVGRINITDASIALIRDAIESILREKTSAATATLGPQLVDYEVKSLEQLPASLGTLKVEVSLDVPLPMNVIDLTLVI